MVLHFLMGLDRTQSIDAVPTQTDTVTNELGFCASLYFSLSLSHQGLSQPVQILFLPIVPEQLSDQLGKDADVKWVLDCVNLGKPA